MTDALTDKRSQPDEPMSPRGDHAGRTAADCRAVFDNIERRVSPGVYFPTTGVASASPPTKKPETVNHPKHYNSSPSGIEVIDVIEHLNFCMGNVVKYVLRADHKGNAIEDLEKAAWYLKREIERRKKG